MIYKIYKNGNLINSIVSDLSFVESYCKENGYTFEAENRADTSNNATATPTLEDRVSTLETETADLNEALNMILTGVTE